MIKYEKFLANCKHIKEYYNYLITLTNSNIFVGATNEWIIDNYYLTAEIKANIKKIMRDSKRNRRALTKYDYLYDQLLKIYEDNGYNVDFSTLIESLRKYQQDRSNYLCYDAIGLIPVYSCFILIDRLNLLCISKNKVQQEKQRARNLVKIIEEKLKNDEDINISDYIVIDQKIVNSPQYLEQLNDSLKEFGSASNEIFIQLDKVLDDNNLSLKEIINNQQLESINNNILVANIFNSLRIVTKLLNVKLYDKISKTEQILKQDFYYRKMTQESKQLYRSIIIKRTKNCDEYDYVCRLLQKSKTSDKHIGFYLKDKENLKLRSNIYVGLVLVLSIVISFLLAKLTLNYTWIAFALLLVPISELVIKIINKIYLHIYPCKPLPKIDFSKGIPKENATMVVLPTIIKDNKKIDKVFMVLEKYYLANKSDNLYFSLLADCSGSDKQELKIDKEIIEHGKEISDKLNEKYNKKIFSFVYRKRVFNEAEGEFLGYERKRGALIHFNKLLLNKFTPADKERFINFEDVTKIEDKIKYVITIDVDTEWVLNNALALVGIMAHPLNKPILNEEKTKVISGYGIIQPRVTVNIESTNKSIYSQLMAGIGGFDAYSTMTPNFYHDVFREGSFVGKGLYDLEVFDTILSSTFPDNLILSHDLIEGNYLRCGYASDIELIEDFPSQFLVETSRQHRWTRGDTQIIGWLGKKVPNKSKQHVKNPLNLIEKFKIFDNIRRAWFNPMLLLLIILSFVMGNPIFVLSLVLLIIFLPMLFYIKELLQLQNKKLFTFKYYNNLMFGFLSVLYRLVLSFMTIPYYAYLYVDAFFRAIFRMFISHKNLLNWVTAEDAGKIIKNDLKGYLSAFKVNYIVSIILIIITSLFSPRYLFLAIVITIVFALAPVILYLVSRDNNIVIDGLGKEEKKQIKDIAYRTWLYFDLLLTEENNYLIPDNFQLNRENREDTRSSATDIGMSLTSIVSANELGFIDNKRAIFLIEKVISSIEKLEKWNGHLYNWYDIKKMEKIVPFVISSVDSGNLAATLVVTKEFCLAKKEEDLYNRISNLFDAIDFSKLYNEQDVFSVVYNTVEDQLSPYNYNNFASESRILSFIAIMKGDVPSKHWLCLDKSLTKHKKHKGLVSWGGTSFEYYMPLLFMKSYPNTLLDESYFFARFCQKSYISEIDKSMPWGISESAYDELDDGLNYKYKTFTTPYLKVIDDKEDRLVLSPYSSIIAITEAPSDVYHNLKKFKRLEMYGELGFYESYDYTTNNRVLAYYTHHQGMNLAAITNYLKNGKIRDYFHSDLRTQAFDILLKEKVQLNPVIDLDVVGYKKYDYKRETIVNDIREYNYLSEIPQLSILSNSKYSVLINDRGNGFSRYNTIQLNRYRKITEQDYGTYLYVKDLTNNKIWSNTYAPTNIEPDKYNVVFANDRIKFLRVDEDVTTNTEVIVTKEHDAEIRKVTFTNNSNSLKILELTSYTETIIEPNIDDIIHRTFRNLFVESTFDSDTNSLIMCRRNNSKKISNYMLGRLLVPGSDNEISYETERENFIGRGYNTPDPIALNKKLSNTAGTNIDPVISLRTRIEIAPNEEKTVYYIGGFSKSYEGIMSIVESYNDERDMEKAFDYATISSSINSKLLGIDGYDIRTYNIMLNYLYQTSRHFIGPERKQLLSRNSLTQSGLWKFGISGDQPIILANIHDGKSFRFAKDIIRAYEYFKSRSIFIDLVIINSESVEYKNIIKREVEQEIYRMNKLFDFNATPGRIYVLDVTEIDDKELNLLNMVARLCFNTKSDSSLIDSVRRMNLENNMIGFNKTEYEKADAIEIDTSKIDKYNNFGGFINGGSEYLINNPNTPLPWSNVIANKKIGTIVTNNECGFTFSENSQMFKLTSWTNDIVVNDKSEGIKVNDKEVPAGIVKHGFGYSIINHYTKKYDLETIQFVAKEDRIKFYKLKLTNNTSKKSRFKVTFWLNPTLGPNEEKSSRYILTEENKDANAVFMRNVYNPDFSNMLVFMSSTVPVSNVTIDRIIYKAIDITIDVGANETSSFSFLLGTDTDKESAIKTIKKYQNQNNIEKEYKEVKTSWKKTLGTIKVKTPDKSLDYMLNGWYLYQTLSSRILAKAGFYQVGGAFGFRDQLQDSMNICEVFPEQTRKQIITNAMHQFESGDVLHWWHQKSKLGLRSRYTDDYLWLIYAVNKYITVTGDKKILDEEVCFVTGEELTKHEEEKGIIFNYSDNKKTILEHCLLAINRAINLTGENGIPLMGGGDWNDGMNKVGIGGKGTSVWLGFFLHFVLDEFIKNIKHNKIVLHTDGYETYLQKLKKSLNTVAWDGNYYLRAFFDNGDSLGGNKNDECKIDLISQSFSILSSVAPKERISSIINSVEENLVDKKTGIIKLLSPPFKNTKNIPGYIMDYPKGIRENGGQYTHSVAWYIMALIKIGEVDRAYQYYQMINPANKTETKESTEIYKGEPYVIAADIYSNERHPGRGGWTWYTGSAAWFYNVGITNILGFQKEGNILSIKPNVPSDWKNYDIEYQYLDTSYKIKIKLNQGMSSIMIDGEEQKDSFIRLKNDKRLHAIVVNVKGRE